MEEKTQREPVSRPGEPTSAAPGSARKIRVLMERAARKEALFHPLDGIRRRPGAIGGTLPVGKVEEPITETKSA
jgi:hypothetical protein